MEVDRTGSDGAASRHGHSCAPGTSNERPQYKAGGTHGLHYIVGRFRAFEIPRLHLDGAVPVKDLRSRMLVAHTGAKIFDRNGTVEVEARDLERPEAPYDVVKTMRASSLVLGPLVARTGRARVSMPGGCAIGARPINLHVSALEHLGAEIQQSHGYVEAVAPAGLRGAHVKFDRITVTGTED